MLTANSNPAQKSHIDELAIFGGKPQFVEKLHVGRPNIGNRRKFLERVNDLLDRRWLSNRGPFVQEFETRIAQKIGVKHCIAMCNATVALEIAIRAASLTGEVIVPSFTFIATAHALQWQEITPVFCDINSQTHTIDITQVEKLITPKTTGIIGVHLWGRPCAVDILTDIAQRHKLKILFDAAHAFGCSYKGQMIGSFGNAEVFSFHATKFINTFEGGAVVTNDDELASKIRLMKNFGFADYDDVVYIGTNGKMSEISAAMGITSLESLDGFLENNYRNYKLYQQFLSDVDGISLVEYDETEKCNYQYIILEVEESISHINRNQLLEILWAENILARRYFYPGCHNMEPYRSYFPHAHLLLANTNQLSTKVISLPTGTAISVEEIRGVCDVIKLVISRGQEIHDRLMLNR
jgi:dTDP-4-amino-4,6-dideoxygalactose transaminase